MKTVNIGIIGCGWFGNFHIENLLQIESVTIVALVSTNDKKLQETSKKAPSAKLFHSHEELFGDTSLPLDAVVVSVPPAMHKDIENMAAAYGVHLYIEKPIGLSLADAMETKTLIKKAELITTVGYQGLCNPLIEEIKENLKGETIGLVEGKWICNFPQVHWWRQKSLSGGQMVEQTTHIFSVLYYLFGEVKSVYATGLRGLNTYENSTVEDCSSCIITFENGIIGTILSGCYGKENCASEIGFKIHGGKSLINYDWSGKLTTHLNNKIITKTSSQNNHLACMERFINAIKSGDTSQILSDYAHGVKVLEITLAANKSMERGEVIYLN